MNPNPSGRDQTESSAGEVRGTPQNPEASISTEDSGPVGLGPTLFFNGPRVAVMRGRDMEKWEWFEYDPLLRGWRSVKYETPPMPAFPDRYPHS